MLCPMFQVPYRATLATVALSCFTPAVAVFLEGIKCLLTSQVL